MGISVFAPHLIFGSIHVRMTWFCPNNTCFRGRVRRSIVLLPPPPDEFVVKVGTSFSDDEMNFMIQNGVKLRGMTNVSVSGNVTSTAIDCRVNVENFPEKADTRNLYFRFSTRNGKPVRLRSMLSAQHLKRIHSLEEE